MHALSQLVSSGRAADVALGVILIEALVLMTWGPAARRPAPLEVVSALLPGACLLLALRAALSGAAPAVIAAALLAGGLAHWADLRRRWYPRGKGPWLPR